MALVFTSSNDWLVKESCEEIESLLRNKVIPLHLQNYDGRTVFIMRNNIEGFYPTKEENQDGSKRE